MKKTRLLLVIITFAGIAFSTIILMGVYKHSLYQLIEQFAGSVLTGCLCTIPSGLLVINEEIKRFKNEQAELLSNLDTQIRSIVFDDYAGYVPEKTERIRNNVVELYHRLCSQISRNYLKKAEQDKIQKLLHAVFDFSHNTAQLDDNFKNITQTSHTKNGTRTLKNQYF
ncbi:MAG: hypothetical protein NC123_11440, partial [Butyrivibrio sp.]|nr:hypothetical protein [Butyrivibrio sp.]